MNRAELIASIAVNPGAHQVNREEKMERTINKMFDNAIKQAEQREKAINQGVIVDTSNRGYGEGRRMGD